MTKNGHNSGVIPVQYLSLGSGKPFDVDGEIVEEVLSCITVNGHELATFMCTPTDLDKLALGFLYNEGFFSSMREIESIFVSKSHCVEIWLQHFNIPERKIVTAGCGGGVTFDDLSTKYQPLKSDQKSSHPHLVKLIQRMHLGAALYQRSRGIHTAALADESGILIQVEDVGRHNCIDKLAGAALTNGLITRGKILLSSGRISSEMINKARRLEIPIVCSRTSPTSLSVKLAEEWNITIAAYIRQNKMRIYTHPERIGNYKN